MKQLRSASALLLALICLAPAAWAHEGHNEAGGAAQQKGTATRGAQPSLAVTVGFDLQGNLWRARVSNGHVLVDRSTDQGRSFGPASVVNPEPETIGAEGDSRPKIALGPDGAVYVSYTRALGKPYTGDIRFSRSRDGGRTFSPPLTVNDNRDIISHRFDSLTVGADGRVYVAWLDKRDQSAAKARGENYVGAALYYAVSGDRGAGFAANVKLADHTCECCRIALALDVDGVPVAFWRHVYPGDERDHALLRLDGSGTPQRVTHDRWRTQACPHHGPALSISAAGVRHLAWFNQAPDARGLFYARSADGGSRFTAARGVGDPAAQAGHAALLAGNGEVFLVWKEFDGSVTRIQFMHSADDGVNWTYPQTVAQTMDASDHPQLAAHAGRVFLSWNTLRDGYRLLALNERRP